MKFLDRVASRMGYSRTSSVRDALARHAVSARAFQRNFEAGSISRLTADFAPSSVSIDTDLIRTLRLMRARSRTLFKNEPYARRFGRLAQKNIVGPAGVQLTVLGSDEAADGRRLSLDEAKAIEDRWKQWGASGWVTTDRRFTFRQAQRLAVLVAATSGEVVVRLVPSAANPFLLSLKFLVPDQLDEAFNTDGNETQIRLAVESRIATGERVAYWPFRHDPSDIYGGMRRGSERVRLDAAEVVHWFLPEAENQSRGIPWLFAAIPQLNMLNGYADAELVASRVAASKMGFFIPPEGTAYKGDGTDAEGNTITEASPGTFEELPPGSKLEQFDPQHPNANFTAFQKAMLHGTAAAGDVSYHTLSGDLGSVNYSSARIGLLDERDGYTTLQDEFVAGFVGPIFRAWLVAQAALGTIPLGVEEAQTFAEFMWRPRRWGWVDPQKEIAAAQQAVGLRIKSRTAITAEMGEEFAVTAAELAAEEKLLESLGLDPVLTINGGSPPAKPDEKDDDETEEPPQKPPPAPKRNGNARRADVFRMGEER